MKTVLPVCASLLLLSGALGGCAGVSSARGTTGYARSDYSVGTVTAQSSGGSYAPSPSGAPAAQPTGGYGSTVSGDMVAPATTSASRTPSVESNGGVAPGYEPPPSQRQGLATEYGETRASAMTYTPFVRASSQPFDTAAVFYNDASGVTAQAAFHAATTLPYFGVYNNGIRVSLRDEGNSPLAGYRVNDRNYVFGHAGQRYTIVLENSTAARFEAVVSVDGLDVINGETAGYTHRGYILPPYGRLEIDGFRQDLHTVAAFRFGAVGDSYAAQMGSARNVGVIGVALFSERGVVLQPYQDPNETILRETASPFPNQFAPPPPRRGW
ncbi:MAG: hypothetical protein HY909_30515 [Deltaproteobacteria bacterium]|nr:hypothetical protein [Deltaproteobacteria bacterium]